jgi:hypothetical protein
VVISRDVTDASLTMWLASGSDESVVTGSVIVTEPCAGIEATSQSIVVSPAPGPALTPVSLKPAEGVALAEPGV